MRRDAIEWEPLVVRIKQGAHWNVVFHPTKFNPKLLNEAAAALDLVSRCFVRLRGWDYPHIDTKENRESTSEYFASWVESAHHREFWRLYLSGQFVHLFSLVEDEPEHHAKLEAEFPYWDDQGPRLDGYLNIITTIYTVTEIHEFLARLAIQRLFDEGCELQISLRNIQNRGLSFSSPERSLSNEYFTRNPVVSFERTYSRDELLADSKGWARECARLIFAQFGATFTPATISDMQSSLFRR